MTIPEPMASFLAAFKADFDIHLPFDEDSPAAERAETAARYAADNTPRRFADAVPDVPQVQAWVADVVQTGVAESARGGQRVPTIHEGPSLLLLGPTGSGKTFQGYGAVRAISYLGVHTQWVVLSAADLYAKLRPRHGVDSEQVFESIADAAVLVVNDMGTGKQSDWTEEVNFRLVDRRYETVRPTIFTSNVPPRDVTNDAGDVVMPGLATVLGERVASRLTEMCDLVPMLGPDKRRPK